MSKFYYELYDSYAYLTDFKSDGSPAVELYVKDCEKATVSLGKAVVSIQNGRGRVKIPEITDGIHTPTLVYSGRVFKLAGLRVSDGIAEPAEPRLTAAEENRRYLALARRTAKAEDELAALAEAVYGKKIF